VDVASDSARSYNVRAVENSAWFRAGPPSLGPIAPGNPEVRESKIQDQLRLPLTFLTKPVQSRRQVLALRLEASNPDCRFSRGDQIISSHCQLKRAASLKFSGPRSIFAELLKGKLSDWLKERISVMVAAAAVLMHDEIDGD